MYHSKTVETLVGLFILIGLSALLVLALRISNLSELSLLGDAGYRVRAKFENIGGLKIRAPVKMGGVVIGRVSAIGLDPSSYEAVAILTIEKNYKNLPEDTSANIYTTGLLGEQYVSLEPGGEETFLKEGDEITLTQSAVVLERVLGQFLYNKASGDGQQ
ncbi:MAG: outer membrane lipid asymmetry maintenance protein MlaD [Gammaproteobacteria bacterium]